MPKSVRLWSALGGMACLALAGPSPAEADFGRAAESPAAQEPAGLVLLQTDSFWRWHLTWGTELARLASGELAPVHPDRTTERTLGVVDGKKTWVYPFRRHDRARYWPLPPAGWAQPDFPDCHWAQGRGPFTSEGYGSRKRSYVSSPLMCYRGKFRVDDPAGVGPLDLSVSFLGGAVVYVNGREVKRAFLPEGKLELTTPAEDYPAEALFDAQGRLWDWDSYRKDPAALKALKMRVRRLAATVPASMLRKGVNVLAVELHRPPAPEKFFTGRGQRYPNPAHVKVYCWWSRIGLHGVRLTARPGAAATPNSGHTGRPKGLQVWVSPIFRQLYPADYAEPSEPLCPVTIFSTRNGVNSGQLVVSSDEPIKGLKVECAALTGPSPAEAGFGRAGGPGAIPASAIRVRYALADGRVARNKGPAFDGLEDFPPAEVPVHTAYKGTAVYGAVQPVWLTVRVPPDARPGDYQGAVTISAAGRQSTKALLKLRVFDWKMPDSTRYFAHLGLIQSPESVALYYNVPLWSQRHWQLLDRTFRLLGEAGNKVVWITAQRRTHFGNEHSMIRWVRGADGKLTPDLSIAEKYLDLAVRRQGKVPMVGLCCWRCPWSTGHYGHHAPQDADILISILDPSTGRLSEAKGPAWGTPQCRAFWRPVFDGMKAILEKHGLADSLMIGTVGDYWPTDSALEDLKAASGGRRWIFHSHIVRHRLGSKKDHPTGYIADGWGGHCHHPDPEFGRGYGWKNDFMRTRGRGCLGHHAWMRLGLEWLVTSRIQKRKADDQPDYGLHGMGRIGADFWPVLGRKGGRGGSLAGRYPETGWGQMSLYCCGLAVLAPGRDGALGTVRLELLRENAQEIEARIFIEKILNDPAGAPRSPEGAIGDPGRARLGEALPGRALRILDERTRACTRCQSYRESLASGIRDRQGRLYELAAEVAGAMAAGR